MGILQGFSCWNVYHLQCILLSMVTITMFNIRLSSLIWYIILCLRSIIVITISLQSSRFCAEISNYNQPSNYIFLLPILMHVYLPCLDMNIFRHFRITIGNHVGRFLPQWIQCQSALGLKRYAQPAIRYNTRYDAHDTIRSAIHLPFLPGKRRLVIPACDQKHCTPPTTTACAVMMRSG